MNGRGCFLYIMPGEVSLQVFISASLGAFYRQFYKQLNFIVMGAVSKLLQFTCIHNDNITYLETKYFIGNYMVPSNFIKN